MSQVSFEFTELHPERTAISRKQPSKPCRLLMAQDLLKGRILDYGCGKGADAEALGATKWDPYHHPVPVTGTFDTVLCTYVLNVVMREERDHIRNEILSLLRPNGTAFVTVRRDLDKGVTITRRGTYQEWVDVEEEWPEATLIHADSICAIYAVRRAFVDTLETRGESALADASMEELAEIEFDLRQMGLLPEEDAE